MIVVMTVSAVEEDVGQVISAIEARGLSALRMPGGDRVAVGIPSAIPPDLREPVGHAVGEAGQRGRERREDAPRMTDRARWPCELRYAALSR